MTYGPKNNRDAGDRVDIGRDPRVAEALRALDPGSGDPGYWFRFQRSVMRAAQGELARRRMVVDLTVSDVVTSWSRAVLPTALAVAVVATMLLVRPSLVGVDDERSAPLALEEMLVEDLTDAWAPPAEPDPTTVVTFAGSF